MSDWEIKTPVLFLIFNRPDTTQRVFNEIRRVKPKELFVSADGPRENKPLEVEKCQATRDIVLKQVDWDCKVYTNFRDKNLGCKIAVSSGIDWFFENVEEGIVLEDDTLPHPTFFRFCEELLQRYSDDSRIMMISGDNFQFGQKRTPYSYYFSRYPHIWGWASWRRAWKYYDVEMRLWPEIRDGKWLFDILGDKKAVSYWMNIFEKVYKGEINTWDYQLTFAFWIQSGLTILPNVNLISNIGFTCDATHTRKKNKIAGLKFEPLQFPLIHPPVILRDNKADDFTQNGQFKNLSLLIRAIKWLLK